MSILDELINKNYGGGFTLSQLMELLEEVIDSNPLIERQAADTENKELVVTMPVIRISEKMWGKEGSEDREIIQRLLSRIVTHGTTLKDKIDLINNYCLRINDFMQGMFRGIGIKLVDFKLEFGRSGQDNNIILADEISPDTCRLWDSSTEKKLDKDIFRKDLGNLIEGYQEVAKRLNILHEQTNIRPIKFPKPKAVKIKKK